MKIQITGDEISVEGQRIHLTGKETAIVKGLAATQSTRTKQQLMDICYGGLDEPEIKIIDVFVCKIRNKFKKFGVNPIATVWGRGYAWNHQDCPVERIDEGCTNVPIPDEIYSQIMELAGELSPKAAVKLCLEKGLQGYKGHQLLFG